MHAEILGDDDFQLLPTFDRPGELRSVSFTHLGGLLLCHFVGPRLGSLLQL